MRRHRPDNTQADIVKELRKLGYIVRIIGEPVDLLCRHPSWLANAWVLLECKSPNRVGGGYVPTKKQLEQIAFCKDFEVPYVLSYESAREYLELQSLRGI